MPGRSFREVLAGSEAWGLRVMWNNAAFFWTADVNSLFECRAAHIYVHRAWSTLASRSPAGSPAFSEAAKMSISSNLGTVFLDPGHYCPLLLSTAHCSLLTAHLPPSHSSSFDFGRGSARMVTLRHISMRLQVLKTPQNPVSSGRDLRRRTGRHCGLPQGNKKTCLKALFRPAQDAPQNSLRDRCSPDTSTQSNWCGKPWSLRPLRTRGLATPSRHFINFLQTKRQPSNRPS